MKKLFFYFVIVFMAVSLNISARDGEGITADPFILHFMTDIGLGYDSNVFLELDEQSDLFLFLRAYTDLDYNLSRDAKLYTSYEGTFFRFDDFDSQDSDNHSVSLGFSYEGQNLYTEIKQSFLDTSNVNGTIFTNRIERKVSEPSILVGLDFNKLALELKYSEHRRRYDDELNYTEAGFLWERPYEYYDHDRKYLFGSAIFHLFTKTDLFLEYRSADIDYKESLRDGDFEEYMVGIKGDITSKINGAIRAGYQDRQYDNSDQEFDNFVSAIELDFKFTEDSTLNFDYVLTANEAIIFQYNYYEINRLSLDWDYESTKDFYFNIGGFLEDDDFPATTIEDREDDVYGFHLYVGYKFKVNMALEINYDYLERDSNLDEYDYEQHNVMLIFSYVL